MEKFNIPLSKDGISKLPSVPGVYLFKKGSDILYIGKSVNLKARLSSHWENAKLDAKEAAIISRSDTITYFVTDSEFKALILESKLINEVKPKYNVIWRDDKSSLYVKITTTEKYPKVYLVRKTDVESTEASGKDGGNSYFGPFPSTRSAESILREIRRIFPFCSQRSKSKNPCFYSKIGLCVPCPSEITKSNNSMKGRLSKLYRYNIRQVMRILNGEIEPVMKKLHTELKSLSKKRKFEQAINIRSKIVYFEQLIYQRVFSPDLLSHFNRSAESRSQLLKLLNPYFPGLQAINRLECYDISNLAQKEATASMVVFVDGIPDRKEYRRFKVRNQLLSSDFEMLDEVVKRRFRHKEWHDPDLVVIDGGKPQVRTVMKAFAEINVMIPLIGIAKHPDRLIIGNNFQSTIFPPYQNLGFNLIRANRDESHRFAKKYHVFLRDRKFSVTSKKS